MKTKVDFSRCNFVTGITGGVAAVALISTPSLAPTKTLSVLKKISRWNDHVQTSLYSKDRLTEIYSKSEISSNFPFNGFYPQSLAPNIDVKSWRLTIEGRVEKQLSLRIQDLRVLHAKSQTTRLICIEGWSAIGQWAGPRVSDILKLAKADLDARYVEFHCSDGYWTSIDMASALHTQSIIALDFLGRPLPIPFGRPARLRIPTKLGFKNAKHIEKIVVSNDWSGGYWEDQGYNWFAGL